MMYASMVCQWAGGSGGANGDCSYTVADARSQTGDSSTFSGVDANVKIWFDSKDTGKTKLFTSERYENRYCKTEDYLDFMDVAGGSKDYAMGVPGDDFSAIAAIIK